jgi:hypothetical protein
MCLRKSIFTYCENSLMPYLSTSGKLGESLTSKSWNIKTYVFDSWTFNSPDLLKYGIF